MVQAETEVILPPVAGIHMYELQRINVARKLNDRIELQQLMKNGVEQPWPDRILAGCGRSISCGVGKVYDEIRAAEKTLWSAGGNNAMHAKSWRTSKHCCDMTQTATSAVHFSSHGVNST